MTALTELPEKVECEICHGRHEVKVGWHLVIGSTCKIKVEYDPCPNCTPGPHTFRAKMEVDYIRALIAQEAARQEQG